MTSATDYFDADMGLILVQPDGPNTATQPLICHSSDGMEEPQGDVTSRLCRTTRGWQVTSRAQGTPGEVTMTIEAYLAKTRSWLQLQAQKRCSMPVYFHMNQCGMPTTFNEYQFGQLGKNAIITNKSKTGMVRGMADAGDGAADASKASYELSAEPGAPEYWKLQINAPSIAEAETLRDIAFDTGRCLGPCGVAKNNCTDGTITPNFTVASSADVWHTADGGTIWAAGATDPFAVSENISSVVRFKMDANTTRILVACGTAGAAGLRVNYSDDGGATWGGAVAVSASATDFAAHGGALFALDSRHIWLCTHLGLVYFSNDGGLTWTDQGAPTPTPAENLMCVRFAEENRGMCVGGTTAASSVLLTTVDGGAHWTLGTFPTIAHQATGVTVIDGNRAWCCFENGELWYTTDYGLNWTQRTLPTSATDLGDVDFYDEFMGVCVGASAGVAHGKATVWRTLNGGWDWEVYVYATDFDATPTTYFGLNSVWICDYNKIWAVGEPVNSFGLVLLLTP